MSEFLTPGQAGKVLGLSPGTLSRYRTSGNGPAYYKFGKAIRYRIVDVAAWAAERRVRRTPKRPPRRIPDKATTRRKFFRSLKAWTKPLDEESPEPKPPPR